MNTIFLLCAFTHIAVINTSTSLFAGTWINFFVCFVRQLTRGEIALWKSIWCNIYDILSHYLWNSSVQFCIFGANCQSAHLGIPTHTGGCATGKEIWVCESWLFFLASRNEPAFFPMGRHYTLLQGCLLQTQPWEVAWVKRPCLLGTPCQPVRGAAQDSWQIVSLNIGVSSLGAFSGLR